MTVKIEAKSEVIHETLLGVITALFDLDPPLNSPECRLLSGLADVIEDYEKRLYPQLSQPAKSA